MIRGMTGFGRSQGEEVGLRVAVEVRTVNHRFADVRLRLPRVLVAAEADLRRLVVSQISRGRAEISVHTERTGEVPAPVHLQRPFVAALMAAVRQLRDEFGISGELDARAILGFSESLASGGSPEELEGNDLQLVNRVLQQALDAADAMRRDEGAMMARDLENRLSRLQQLRQGMEERAGSIPREAANRLAGRLQELVPQGTAVDPARLAQEVALLADRADVTEELVRLQGYLAQALDVLRGEGDDAGKRLDFLLQEMNREVNTVGSKAGDAAMGHLVVEAKLELERVREQAQNIA